MRRRRVRCLLTLKQHFLNDIRMSLDVLMSGLRTLRLWLVLIASILKNKISKFYKMPKLVRSIRILYKTTPHNSFFGWGYFIILCNYFNWLFCFVVRGFVNFKQISSYRFPRFVFLSNSGEGQGLLLDEVAGDFQFQTNQHVSRLDRICSKYPNLIFLCCKLVKQSSLFREFWAITDEVHVLVQVLVSGFLWLQTVHYVWIVHLNLSMLLKVNF